MLASLRWVLLPALWASCLGLLLSQSAEAQAPPEGFRIKDQGKFFSNDALSKAENAITQIKKSQGKDVFIETYATIPPNLKATFDKEGKDKFFANWLRNRAGKEKVDGVAILICKDPQYLVVESSKSTREKAFTAENGRELREVLARHFKEDQFDRGLLAGVNFIGETMQKNLGVVRTTPPRVKLGSSKGAEPGPTAPPPGEQRDAQSNILGWVCIGVAGLLALWLLVGLVRAFSGAGRPVPPPPGGTYPQPGRPVENYGPRQGGMPVGGAPPPGYGAYPPAPPAGGGAGGGFVRSMLGGMLGGAAGMWAYDTFFRGGGASGPGMTPPAYGGGTTSSGTGAGYPQQQSPDAGEWGSSASSQAAGGDWGSSSPADTGGGDWGSSSPADTGGGDWGSAPADSGGDWGGGGGDSGGGDWGGGGGDSGGGGDWGGGGGDWGGGGGDSGGGDW